MLDNNKSGNQMENLINWIRWTNSNKDNSHGGSGQK